MADITPIASLTGKLAMPEKVWMQGPPGPQGQQGEPGAAATVTVGTVTTGEPGTDAVVINSGTESAAVLDFTIPRGETGAAGQRGPKGDKGDTGETGPAGAGVPDGGTVGQLLGKTETGTSWIDPPQSGVQPDWNQNDSTAADYVKNRPFYTGATAETVLVEESTVEFVDGGCVFQSTFEATAGESYKINWDDATYESACVDLNGKLVIGNLSVMGREPDTGEPFLMMVSNGKGIVITTTDTSASHTFSISGFVSEVLKIDDKYIPTIPADKLPTIPADKLPTISADKLPTIPVIEFTISIKDNIAATSPSFNVSNLSYSEIYSIVEKGYFQMKDSSGFNYRPIKFEIDSSGNIFVDILVFSTNVTIYAQLVCNANQTVFYRNLWWQIEATQK